MFGARKGHHGAHSKPRGGCFVLAGRGCLPAAGGLRGRPKAGIDLCRNLAVSVIQIVTGAGLVGKPAVYGHVLLVHLADQGLVRFPLELLDAIALADVHAQVYKGLVRRIRHRIGVGGIAGHLNGDGSVVVAAGG